MMTECKKIKLINGYDVDFLNDTHIVKFDQKNRRFCIYDINNSRINLYTHINIPKSDTLLERHDFAQTAQNLGAAIMMRREKEIEDIFDVIDFLSMIHD